MELITVLFSKHFFQKNFKKIKDFIFNKKFFRYFVVNIVDSILYSALVFILIVKIGKSPYCALAISYVVTQFLTFFIKKFWVYEENSRKKVFKEFVAYIIISLLLYKIHTSSMNYLWTSVRFPYLLSLLISNTITMTFGYVLNKVNFKTA